MMGCFHECGQLNRSRCQRSLSVQAAAGSLITEMKVQCFRCVEGGQRFLLMRCCAVGTHWHVPLPFYLKSCSSFLQENHLSLFCGLHIRPLWHNHSSKVYSFSCFLHPRPQPALPFPPQCLLYHLSLVPRWISFTTSWHTCLLIKMFALLAAAVYEFQLDTFGFSGGILVEWNVSKCGEGREK